MGSISCFLPPQKILFVAKVIAGRRLAPMCNYIACTNFNRDFPTALGTQFSWDHPETLQALTRYNLEQKARTRIFI